MNPNDRRSFNGCRAFTLIELVAIIAVVFVLIGVLIPAFGGVRRKAGVLECKDNLRQVGVALNSYTADHSNVLPGPLWRAAYYNCGTYSFGQYSMAGFLTNYMPFRKVSINEWQIDTLQCPSAVQAASPRNPLAHPTTVPVSYLVTTYVTNGIGNRITNVFGYPFSQTGGANRNGIYGVDDGPLKISSILRPSENWSIVDLDQQNSGSASYFSLLPRRPVHSNRPDGGKNSATRNYLYFDGSVRTTTETF